MDDPRARDLLERCMEELACPQSVISIREPCAVCRLKAEVRAYLGEPERGALALERCVDVLQFYADPATYEVLHYSTDPDVCDSTHCGCTSTPAHVDEGALAKEALSDLHAFLVEPERAGLSMERRVDVIESARRFYEQAKALRHARFYEQAKATGLLLEPASETPSGKKD